MKEKLNWGLLSKYRTEIYGIATIMIMIFHCQVVVPLPGIINSLNAYLNSGVDIFLLMSGICLYFSYSKDNNYASFMKKRAERTLIPYLVIVFFFWVWKNLFVDFDILEFLYNASGLSLILVRNESYLTFGKPKMWYVAFIMLMYILYPVFYKAFFTVSEKKKKINLVSLIVLSVVATIFIRFYAPATYSAIEVGATRIPVFIMGCYLGKAAKEKQKFRITDYILFFSLIPVMLIYKLAVEPVSTDLIFKRYQGFFLCFFVCFVIICFFEIIKNIKFISVPVSKIFTFFGNLSLEIYMIHVLIYNVVLHYIPDIRTSDMFSFREKVLIYAGILAISVILSVIFNKGIGAAKEIIKSKKAS